jgi:site-specific recombinase XerD
MEYMYTVKDMSAEEISFESLTTECIQGFLDWLETDRKCGISTRNQRLSAIAAFARYAQGRNFGEASVFRNNVTLIPKKKAPKKDRNYFTRDEVKLLLDAPNTRNEIGLRDKTLLCFMYASGMRSQEVCDMTVGDIQFYPDKASIRVLGKGKKIRRIGIPRQASEILKRYIDHRGIMKQKERHVFSSQTHEMMSVSCIEEIYAKYIDIVRKENPELFRANYSPHSMRHTTATHMLEAGVPLIVVKNFLGHASLQTTQIYAEVTQETMNRQLRSWNDKWFINEKNSKTKDKANGKKKIPDFLF